MNDSGNGGDADSVRERNTEEIQTTLTGPSRPIHAENVAHFESIVTDASPVLVDFYADWCGPCRLLSPTVESVASRTNGTVVKVDVDGHRGLAAEYDVGGVPTLLLFVDGEPVERLVGVHDEGTLRGLVESHA